MINIRGIEILNDNIVWIISKKNKCIIIDPGKSNIIIKKLEKFNLKPIIILITHLHCDHINGIFKLLKYYPKIKIFTPKKLNFVSKTNQNIIKKEKKIFLFNKVFYIIFTPGHTKIDVSYYFEKYLFCGDILFSGGCGKTIDGCSKNLYFSLKKIMRLPKKTIFFNSHKYTFSNLKFSNYLFKKDLEIKEYFNFIKKNIKNIKYYNNLNFEKKINIFLKTKNNYIKDVINYWYSSYNEINYFCNLRKIKDQF
ncbi:hydroxyacylglutathione hydrolase [Buchnera aphidicola (Periphyllus koelreuteriae)]|uniref:hydroxyacylglutathione hydrolase n=1 Tax=Buchnera aphidicola TaxID=9 RepID=UPI0031B897CB